MEKATPQREVALSCADMQETKAYWTPSQELAARINKVLPKLSKPRTRLVVHLSHCEADTAGSICHNCEIGNLSDTVSKTNPVLHSVGLRIINYPPPKTLLNKHGEKTPVHYWKLVLNG